MYVIFADPFQSHKGVIVSRWLMEGPHILFQQFHSLRFLRCSISSSSYVQHTQLESGDHFAFSGQAVVRNGLPSASLVGSNILTLLRKWYKRFPYFSLRFCSSLPWSHISYPQYPDQGLLFQVLCYASDLEMISNHGNFHSILPAYWLVAILVCYFHVRIRSWLKSHEKRKHPTECRRQLFWKAPNNVFEYVCPQRNEINMTVLFDGLLLKKRIVGSSTIPQINPLTIGQFRNELHPFRASHKRTQP